jgi:ABC-2 type transport system ATP-binding protein
VSAAIEARDLRKSFGGTHAVDDATFTVGEGEVFAFLGPNGAGKTTVLRMLLGLLRPTGGEARVLGVDPATQARAVRLRVGYVSQAHSLYGELTVLQNLRFLGSMYGLSGAVLRERVDEHLARFHLEEVAAAMAGAQPTGVRRRAALAGALLHRPELVILDEPTSGMDPGSRREFWAFLGGLVEGGVTVVVTTHNLEEVEGCDRMALMLAGRIRFEGTPQGFRERWGGPVLRVRAEPWERTFVALKQAFGAALFGLEVHVDRERASEAEVRAVLAANAVEVLQISERGPTMEDAFLRAAEESGRAASSA